MNSYVAKCIETCYNVFLPLQCLSSLFSRNTG